MSQSKYIYTDLVFIYLHTQPSLRYMAFVIYHTYILLYLTVVSAKLMCQQQNEPANGPLQQRPLRRAL